MPPCKGDQGEVLNVASKRRQLLAQLGLSRGGSAPCSQRRDLLQGDRELRAHAVHLGAHLGELRSEGVEVGHAAAATRGTWLARWPDSRLQSSRILKRIPSSARRWRRRFSMAGERGAAEAVEAMT